MDTLVENYPTNFKEPKKLASKISEDFTNDLNGKSGRDLILFLNGKATVGYQIRK